VDMSTGDWLIALTISCRLVLSGLWINIASRHSHARHHSPLYGSGCCSSANRFSACSNTIASARGSVMFLSVSPETSMTPKGSLYQLGSTPHLFLSNSARISIAFSRHISLEIVQLSELTRYRLYSDLT
jgi:hypothetical protein